MYEFSGAGEPIGSHPQGLFADFAFLFSLLCIVYLLPSPYPHFLVLVLIFKICRPQLWKRRFEMCIFYCLFISTPFEEIQCAEFRSSSAGPEEMTAWRAKLCKKTLVQVS